MEKIQVPAFLANVVTLETLNFSTVYLKNFNSGIRDTTHLKLHTYCEETGRHAVVILPSGKI